MTKITRPSKTINNISRLPEFEAWRKAESEAVLALRKLSDVVLEDSFIKLGDIIEKQDHRGARRFLVRRIIPKNITSGGTPEYLLLVSLQLKNGEFSDKTRNIICWPWENYTLVKSASDG